MIQFNRLLVDTPRGNISNPFFSCFEPFMAMSCTAVIMHSMKPASSLCWFSNLLPVYFMGCLLTLAVREQNMLLAYLSHAICSYLALRYKSPPPSLLPL